MKLADRLLRTAAPRDITLMLIGESGVGKELLARRAHELSAHRRGPFIPINCAAIPEALFETELFGHERGAFTGAAERARGKIEAADGGTLFLDEIGEMPLMMQAKILRFLENRQFMRVGGTRKIRANVRLMIATLRPLEEDVRSGRFRADLFYRIHAFKIPVPALRDRGADVSPLIDFFLEEMSRRHGVRPPRLRRDARSQLLRYEWPGNVRQLRNVIETLCLLREGRPVRMCDLPESLQVQAASRGRISDPPCSSTLTLDIDEGLENLTRKIVETAIALEQGNKSRAANRLKVSLRTVQRYVASGRVRAWGSP